MSDNQMLRKEGNLPRPDTNPEVNEETIDLLELFYVLLGKWKQIAAATVACALIAAVAVVFFVTPKYQASSTLYVISPGRIPPINISDLQIGSELTDDYIQVFHLWEVQEQVISELDLPYTYGQLDSMLSVSNASNTRMLKISVTSEDPQEAADIANKYAEVVREYVAKKMVTDKPSIMSTALVPTVPVSPNKTRTVMLGAMLGLCGLLRACSCCSI